MEDKPDRDSDEARKRARSAYDQLRGHVWGLSIDSWSKTQLLGSLDTIYELALTSLERSAPSATSGSPSCKAESA